MTFNEFVAKYGKYQAYLNWITVQRAKDYLFIPEKYHDFFESHCTCGSENIISRMLTQETCIDPKCPVKVGYQLAEMFSRFGIKGLGYANCSKIYGQLRGYDKSLKERGEQGIFHFDTFTEVLLLPWESYPSYIRDTAKGYEFFVACMSIRGKVCTFPQMISMLGLSEIGSKADKIFGSASSFMEWQQLVKDAGGIENYCYKCGVYSPEVILSVVLSMEAIAVADLAMQQSMRSVGLRDLNICITGKASIDGKSCTKAAFVETCNKLCVDDNGVQLLEIKNTSASMTAPFVLSATNDSSIKYRNGLSRGVITDEFGPHEVLMSTTDFYNWLKGAMVKWNTELTKANLLKTTSSQTTSPQTTSQQGSSEMDSLQELSQMSLPQTTSSQTNFGTILMESMQELRAGKMKVEAF